MRVGLRIPPCAPLPELAAFARRAEEAGVDEVWFPDSQLLWRDVFSTAVAAIGATSRLRVGTAVSNVATRHPSVVASAARTVAELASGRFVLGLGVGNSAVLPVGLPPSTGAVLRSGVETIRALLGGSSSGVRLRDPVPVPIYVAASGPRNLRLAGEIADGVILLSGVAPAPLSAATERVREGATGRAPVPMTVSAFCRVTDDVERASRELKPICLGIACNGGAAALSLAGVHVDVPGTLPNVYPDLVHAEDWDAAVQACDPYVSDAAVARFAREFCLFGTVPEIAARIKEAGSAGADAVFLQHVGSYDLPEQLLDDIAPLIRP